jgi:hypothetical protein
VRSLLSWSERTGRCVVQRPRLFAELSRAFLAELLAAFLAELLASGAVKRGTASITAGAALDFTDIVLRISDHGFPLFARVADALIAACSGDLDSLATEWCSLGRDALIGQGFIAGRSDDFSVGF